MSQKLINWNSFLIFKKFKWFFQFILYYFAIQKSKNIHHVLKFCKLFLLFQNIRLKINKLIKHSHDTMDNQIKFILTSISLGVRFRASWDLKRHLIWQYLVALSNHTRNSWVWDYKLERDIYFWSLRVDIAVSSFVYVTIQPLSTPIFSALIKIPHLFVFFAHQLAVAGVIKFP